MIHGYTKSAPKRVKAKQAKQLARQTSLPLGGRSVGTPHHITQRGNNRQIVFRSDHDRNFYLKTLKAKSGQHSLRVLGYCLMTNHVHLVAIPEHPSSMALALGQTHMIYAQRFNFSGRRSGHLWQNRFYSCPLGPTHLVDSLVYSDMNPVRARLAGRAEDYDWSSAAAHISHSDPSGLVDLWAWSDLDRERDWKARADTSIRCRRPDSPRLSPATTGHP